MIRKDRISSTDRKRPLKNFKEQSGLFNKFEAKKAKVINDDIFGKANSVMTKINTKISTKLESIDCQDSTRLEIKLLTSIFGLDLSGLAEKLRCLLENMLPIVKSDLDRLIDLRKKRHTVGIDENNLLTAAENAATATTIVVLLEHLVSDGDRDTIKNIVDLIPPMDGMREAVLAIAIRNSLSHGRIDNLDILVEQVPVNHLAELPTLLISPITDTPPDRPSNEHFTKIIRFMNDHYPNLQYQVLSMVRDPYKPTDAEKSNISYLKSVPGSISCRYQHAALSPVEALIAISL